ELVRAHLGDPTPSGPPPPPPEEPPPPAEVPRSDAWNLGIAGSVIVPTGQLSTGAAAVVTLDWSPDPWLALEVGGMLSVVDSVVNDAAGSASVSPRLAWLGVDLRVPESELAGHRLALGA